MKLPFHCGICGPEFSEGSALFTHIDVSHSEVQEEKIKNSEVEHENCKILESSDKEN